jgi:alpha-beta hydrolase superfamily lysophospholipase
MSEYEIREYDLDDPELPRLFLQSWNRSGTHPPGCVLITHGMAEHTECYDHVAKALCDQNWLVFGWDLQGHGRSPGKRGYIRNFREFSRDLNSIIDKLKNDETLPTENLHLFGHSMGGLIVLQSLTGDHPPNVRSAILSNPALKIAIEVPKIKEMASHWLNQFAPSLTLNNELRYERLSRDPSMVASYSKDPLRHSKISAPLFLGMQDAQKEVVEKMDKIGCPLFFQVSGQDQIIDPQASLDFFKEFDGQKSIRLYEDSYHEVYNDINKQEAIDDLIAYLGEYQS